MILRERIGKWLRKKSLLEIFFLIVFIGGFVQYGSTKGVRQLVPRRVVLQSLGVESSALGPESLSSVNTSEGEIFPEYTNSVTNLCLTGIRVVEESVILRGEWPPDLSLPGGSLDVFARSDLRTNLWENVGRVSLDNQGSSVITEIPFDLLPGDPYYTMFFTLGTCNDTDQDGLSDAYENLVSKTLFDDPDTDGDGLPDGWEVRYGLCPTNNIDGVGVDSDNDGLTNGLERVLGTHPRKRDSDDDGIEDYRETGGIVVEAEPLAWENSLVLDDLTYRYLCPSQGCVCVQFDSPVYILEKSYDYMSVDVNGVVYFDSVTNDVHVRLDTAPYNARGLPLSTNGVTLAPCWMGLRLTTNAPASRIAIVRSMSGKWVEYADMAFAERSDAERISFRIAIPDDNNSFSSFHYRNFPSAARNAVVGVRASKGNFVVQQDWLPQIGCDNEVMLYVDFGFGTDPSNQDTDFDGVMDGIEIENGMNPCQPDTDNDGMDDGWEWNFRESGFNVLIDNRLDGNPLTNPYADMDEDGLSNIEECMLGSNPDCQDTDGDTVNDGVEIAQQSDPCDNTDEGVAESRTFVPFVYGDPSGSHSEKYRVDILPVEGPDGSTMPKAHMLLNQNYGKVSTNNVPLVPGWKYEVRLYHAGTDPSYWNYPNADYDYQLICGAAEISSRPIVVDDPKGLFGSCTSSSVFAAKDKVAYVTPVAFNFTIVSDRIRSYDECRDGYLIDSRPTTINLVTVPAEFDTSTLALSFSCVPVEAGSLVNDDHGTLVTITQTTSRVWRTSEFYWYGVLPDRECAKFQYEYAISLLCNGRNMLTRRCPVSWPEENAYAFWPRPTENETFAGEAKPYPVVNPSFWYCEINFREFDKSSGEIFTEPQENNLSFSWSGQYGSQIRAEEEFHLRQNRGDVPISQGGFPDCYTTNGIKYFITQQALTNANIITSTWIVKGRTAAEARNNAERVIEQAVSEELVQSGRIIQENRGYLELKCKEHVGYNAAWRYHCSYQNACGPNPQRTLHPAFR